MHQIDPDAVERCRSLWDAVRGIGNKVRAIKDLRTATGLGLKESKEIIESGFSDSTLRMHGYEVTQKVMTVGDCIDRLFELTEEMAELHSTMADLGYVKS